MDRLTLDSLRLVRHMPIKIRRMVYELVPGKEHGVLTFILGHHQHSRV